MPADPAVNNGGGRSGGWGVHLGPGSRLVRSGPADSRSLSQSRASRELFTLKHPIMFASVHILQTTPKTPLRGGDARSESNGGPGRTGRPHLFSG